MPLVQPFERVRIRHQDYCVVWRHRGGHERLASVHKNLNRARVDAIVREQDGQGTEFQVLRCHKVGSQVSWLPT